VASIAIFVGIVMSPIPTKVGFYRFIASKSPQLVGLTPAFHHGIEWKYTFERLYENCSKIQGQTALVTGANSGVGYETAKALAKCGVKVTMACRNATKCSKSAQRIKEELKGKEVDAVIDTMLVDTSSLKSVQIFSKEFLEKHKDDGLDMLYLNAGIGTTNSFDKLKLSEDGIEFIFATNYVGHHLMYRILEPLLLKSKMARVVQTSSAASFDTFDHKVATSLEKLNEDTHNPVDMKYYGQSKLAQILWAKHLTKRLGPNSNIYANACHPGAVNTLIWDKNENLPDFVYTIINYYRTSGMWTSEEGALTQLYLGVAVDELESKGIRGKYFHPQAQEVVNPLSLDEQLQEDLWKFSDDLVSKFLL
jgi:WW domain-containing oxidoreductase